MNCREFLIEFEERGTMSEPAVLHLTICADCRKTSERQTQIWLMIDGLKPVAAPSDFDFHVKAKIANAKPSDFQSPRFLPILRYILPLSVAAIVLGLFVFNSTYFSDTQNSSQIAQSNIQKPNADSFPSADSSLSSPIAFAPPTENSEITASVIKDENPVKTPKLKERDQTVRNETAQVLPNRLPQFPKKTVEEDSGGGSRVSSLGVAKSRTPVGINLNSNIFSPVNIEVEKQISDEQLLSFLGIETVLENGRRTVKMLAKDKTGERAGVKVGDVIEKMSGSVLTVLRGTEKLEITLRNDINQKP